MRLEIDWASLIFGGKFTVSLCFTLYLRAIPKYKPGGFFALGVYIWRGLYMEGLIFGILRYYMKKHHVYKEIGSSAYAHCVIRCPVACLVPRASPASVITWKISSPVSQDPGIIPANRTG